MAKKRPKLLGDPAVRLTHLYKLDEVTIRSRSILDRLESCLAFSAIEIAPEKLRKLPVFGMQEGAEAVKAICPFNEMEELALDLSEIHHYSKMRDFTLAKSGSSKLNALNEVSNPLLLNFLQSPDLHRGVDILQEQILQYRTLKEKVQKDREERAAAGQPPRPSLAEGALKKFQNRVGCIDSFFKQFHSIVSHINTRFGYKVGPEELSEEASKRQIALINPDPSIQEIEQVSEHMQIFEDIIESDDHEKLQGCAIPPNAEGIFDTIFDEHFRRNPAEVKQILGENPDIFKKKFNNFLVDMIEFSKAVDELSDPEVAQDIYGIAAFPKKLRRAGVVVEKEREKFKRGE